MKRIGMGLVGPGFVGAHHIDAVRRLGFVDVVAIAASSDGSAQKKADAFGIRTVPAVVVDGFLLACCKNKGPTLRELHAAGLAKPGQVHLESS